MTALSNIPQQAVLPLGAYDREQLERDARRADQRLLMADFDGAGDKSAVLDRIARRFALPEHFGRNLDALYDCITDLEPVADTEQPGFVVMGAHHDEAGLLADELREELGDGRMVVHDENLVGVGRVHGSDCWG